MNRVNLVCLAALGLVVLAGCSGGTGESNPTTSNPASSTGGRPGNAAGKSALASGGLAQNALGGADLGGSSSVSSAAGGSSDVAVGGSTEAGGSAVGGTINLALGGSTVAGGMATGGASQGGSTVSSTSTPVFPGSPTQVNLGGELQISIPAGGVAEQASLSVERWDLPPLGSRGVGTIAASYIIELTSGSGAPSLTAPVTIRFHVDPARLRKDVPAAEAAWVAYWDGAKKRLVDEPCTVDATTGTVTVTTNHFSQWLLYLLGPGDAYGTSPHFTFRFPPAINVVAWGTNDPFEVMARVRSKLETYYDAYVAAGFPGPSWKIPVYLSETDEAGYAPLSGNVELTSRIYVSDMLMFEHEIAHELFHAFQGAQLNVLSLDQRRWFVEAAADYAADALAAHSGQMGKDVNANWANLELDTVDGKHEYATSHLLSWLAAQGKSVAALQNAVFGAWSTDKGVSAFTTAAATKGSFAQTFVEYLAWLYTATNSPLAATPLIGQSISAGFTVDHQLDLPVHVQPAVLTYQVSIPVGQQRLLSWTLPSGVASSVHLLRGGLRGKPESPTSTSTLVSNADILMVILASDTAQLVTAHVELEPDPGPIYLGPTEITVVPIASTWANVQYSAWVTIWVPWPVEVLSTDAAPCAASLSGQSPLMCWAWTLRARSRLPGKTLDCNLRLGGGITPGNGSGTDGIWWEALHLPQVSSTGATYPIPSQPTNVPIPVTGGSTSLWAPIRITRTPSYEPPVVTDIVGAEVQISVEEVPIQN